MPKDLVTKMLDAYFCAGIAAADTFSYTEEMRYHMGEAAKVCHADHLAEIARLRGLLREWRHKKVLADVDNLCRRTDVELEGQNVSSIQS